MSEYKRVLTPSGMLKQMAPLNYNTSLSKEEKKDNDKKILHLLAKFAYQIEKIRFEEIPNYEKFIEVLEKCQQLMSN